MSHQNSFRTRVKSAYRDMSPTEQKISEYVLENIKKVAHSSISDVSNGMGIADSTFFQFTKHLGYNGFTDFKIALLTEDFDSDMINESAIVNDDDDLTIIKKVYESGIRTIQEAETLIDANAYSKAVDFIVSSVHVGFFGIGGSNIMAQHGYHKFLRSPVECFYTSDYDMQIMNVAKMTKDDCVILISHSGLTKGTIEMAEIAKANKTRIIVITSYPLSLLAKTADVILTSTASELEYRSESLPSRLSQYSIIDSLFILTMLRDEEKSKNSMRKVKAALEDSK